MTYDEMNKLMLEVWKTAGMKDATIEEGEADRKLYGRARCTICRGDNGRRYIWYLDDDRREACLDVAANRYLTHEEIVRVFRLDEEPIAISQEMNQAVNTVMQSVKEWELTGEEKRSLRLAQQGNAGALADLLTSLNLQNDPRFAGFFAEIQSGEDAE